MSMSRPITVCELPAEGLSVHPSSFKQCSGDLIFLWGQPVYSVIKTIHIHEFVKQFINIVNIKIILQNYTVQHSVATFTGQSCDHHLKSLKAAYCVTLEHTHTQTCSQTQGAVDAPCRQEEPYKEELKVKLLQQQNTIRSYEWYYNSLCKSGVLGQVCVCVCLVPVSFFSCVNCEFNLRSKLNNSLSLSLSLLLKELNLQRWCEVGSQVQFCSCHSCYVIKSMAVISTKVLHITRIMKTAFTGMCLFVIVTQTQWHKYTNRGAAQQVWRWGVLPCFLLSTRGQTEHYVCIFVTFSEDLS